MKTLIAALALTSLLTTVSFARNEHVGAIGAKSNDVVLKHNDAILCGHYTQTDPSSAIRSYMRRDCGNGQGNWESAN
jgi:hypothetical protein